ncbi:glutathione S-transferase [Azomonas agilis]|uniref:Glutathione S-transferase n=1 Tax=Azomonas agilis TaxID=116849 RepID=A0A562IXY8_9GAMM|nr:glutathione S-transferase family protein [Azomonas agilis]TWH75788.1 glutathione S-transferase [Azomonas agilis]
MSSQATLYGAPLSPFVRKTQVCLHEKGLDYQLEIVMPFNTPDGYQDISPLKRIPGFRDEQVSLADSSVICQYLEDQYPQTPRLYGTNAQESAKIRWFEKYADYELAPLTTFCIFVNRLLRPARGEPCDEQAIELALTQKLPPHFDYLEQQLGTRNYLVGSTLSMADIALSCQLISLEYAGESLDANCWPALDALHARTKVHPSFSKVLSSEQAILEGLYAAVGKKG